MAQSDSTPRILSVDEILACNDIQEEIVEVPKWGTAVRIRGFTKAQQQRIRRDATSPSGKLDDSKLELLMFCAGVIEPKFEDIQFLNLQKKSAGAIDYVLKRILVLSGLDPESLKSGSPELSD